LFWKTSRLNVINLYAIELKHDKWEKADVFNKDNICIIGLFSMNGKPNTMVMVANTHLLFNNNRGDIKIAQIYQIKNAMAKLSKIYGM